MLRGSYRHPITIHVPETYDIGNEVATWKVVAAPRAKVRVLEVGESSGSDYQMVELVEFKIAYIRHLETTASSGVISFRGREFEITGIKNPDYMDKELVLMARRDERSARLS